MEELMFTAAMRESRYYYSSSSLAIIPVFLFKKSQSFLKRVSCDPRQLHGSFTFSNLLTNISEILHHMIILSRATEILLFFLPNQVPRFLTVKSES